MNTTAEVEDAPASLAKRVAALDTHTALKRLDDVDPIEVAKLLAGMPPARANAILAAMDPAWRARIMAAAPEGIVTSDGTVPPIETADTTEEE